jgi:hypothetical protein
MPQLKLTEKEKDKLKEIIREMEPYYSKEFLVADALGIGPIKRKELSL